MFSLFFVFIALGIVVLVSGAGLLLGGVILATRWMKIAGVIVSLVGLCIVVIPVLTFVYVAVAMR